MFHPMDIRASNKWKVNESEWLSLVYNNMFILDCKKIIQFIIVAFHVSNNKIYIQVVGTGGSTVIFKS